MMSAAVSFPAQQADRSDPAAALLRIEDLRVEFTTHRGIVRAVDGVSYDVRPGELVAVVGESGCGKSMTALSVMRLLPAHAARITGGRIIFRGQDLAQLPAGAMRALRGRDIAMIFQEPMTSLNPVLSIAVQIMEPLTIHLGLSPEAARARAAELLRLVGLSDPERRLEQYPHELSGGMRQRVMIAIALACDPMLIIADEPTTALDVTIQAQILELMKDLSHRLGIALIVITHNLGIVARYADRINVMYAGRVVEHGDSAGIFHAPRHPYTLGLLQSVPRLDRPRVARLATIPGMPPDLRNPPKGCRFAPRCTLRAPVCDTEPALRRLGRPDQAAACHRAEDVAAPSRFPPTDLLSAPGRDVTPAAPLLSVRGLGKSFRISTGQGGLLRAVTDLSFDIPRGQTLGLVGESGCGKTTVGRMLVHLTEPSDGEIRFDGADTTHLARRDRVAFCRRAQIVFQDPYSSLNPRSTVGHTLAEPLRVHRLVRGRRARAARVGALLDMVGLPQGMAERYPHQLSGGQRQRVGIARALAMEPSFIVCDEAVSALDVSIQGQIINLLEDLQRDLGLTYLFIAHDLAVVRHISHRIAVMYLGRMMEIGAAEAILSEPLHPYTRALLDAAPVPDPTIERARQPRSLQGELPSPLAPPSGCVFRTRCPLASAECAKTVPAPREIRPGHFGACIKL
jgi:peptide/nickel transport system ATP-binding protein